MASSLAGFLQTFKAFIFHQSLFGALEHPRNGQVAAPSLLVSGWAFSPGHAIRNVEASLNGSPPVHIACGLERPDVAQVFDDKPHSRHSGFHGRIAVDSTRQRSVTLSVRVVDDAGSVRVFERRVEIAAQRLSSGASPAERIRRAARAASNPLFTSAPLPSTTIVVPVFEQAAYTDACLRQLLSTIDRGITAEIVVVDDASRDDTAATLAHWRERDARVRIVTNPINVGFGESCNRGARAARHDILVFLNNDTLPQPDWLPPLLAPFSDARVGAVGARLLYPDGSLQEAGGVVFSDGSAWNFGKGASDPDDPLFAYVREVDYCSAAALATPRAHFEAAGGFDARFGPAYYEDTDYCFTLRARGLKVLYQPASVIVHAEGATAGTDETQGVKQSQAKNRAVFRDKWQTVLAAQPPPPPAVDRAALFRHAVRRSQPRRALVCAPTLPEWDRESGSRRIFDLVTFLRERDWAVTFVAESAGDAGERYQAALQQMGVAAYIGAADELILLDRYDVALLHFWWTAERYAPLLRQASRSTRVVVDSIDLHFLRRSRDPRSSPDASSEKQRELAAYGQCDAVLTVSGHEANIVRQLGATAVYVVPDAESLCHSPLDFDARGGLLFLGNFRHHPNVDALGWLINAIVPLLPPLLLEQHPLTVVGTDLSPAVVARCNARRPHVQLVGWVPSIDPFIERARVMLAPLRYGAGTKRKLIQSAMIGTPAVSTTIGTEGLPLHDGAHVLVADEPQAFADAVVRLAEDRVLWKRLSAEGRRAICATHDRDVVRRQFAMTIDRLLA